MLRREDGTTLVFSMFLLVALLTLAIAGLTAARSDLQVSRNYRTSVQAMLAAEAGLLHARKVLGESGVIRFDTDVVPLWSSIFASGPVAVSGHADVTYDVSAVNDAIDPVRFAVLRSVGRAPEEAERVMEARVTLDGVFSPGAIYLPSPTVSTTFNGVAFLIDGTNKNLNGTTNPDGAVPAIATSSQSAADSVVDTLSSLQSANVIGLGGTPSVEPAGGASSEAITDTIVPRILARPGVVTNPSLNGLLDTLGTTLTPQITHFTGSVTINGNLTGAGILVVDQGLTISGNVQFTGLIIVRGTTEITAVTGNATLLGALWTTDLNLTVAGSASITYSTEALELVNALGGGTLLPQRVRTVAWTEP
ncbi:MAG: hypothetical protein ACREQ9_06120 [Candidatus Binatia bacterium]